MLTFHETPTGTHLIQQSPPLILNIGIILKLISQMLKWYIDNFLLATIVCQPVSHHLHPDKTKTNGIVTSKTIDRVLKINQWTTTVRCEAATIMIIKRKHLAIHRRASLQRLRRRRRVTVARSIDDVDLKITVPSVNTGCSLQLSHSRGHSVDSRHKLRSGLKCERGFMPAPANCVTLTHRLGTSSHCL